MIRAELTEKKIELPDVLADEGESSYGAQVVFTGVIRDRNQGRRVLGVSYDAFQPLTNAVFHEICSETHRKWGPGLSIRLVHRVGRLAVGEIAVAIVTSSPHRDEAYQASRQIIEELKHRAPIWKKEHYETGDSEWLQGHALCQEP